MLYLDFEVQREERVQ